MNKQPDIRVYPDLSALEEAVAQHFLLASNQAVQQRERALIALSGGSTPLGLFQLLGSDSYRSSVPWQQIHFFWVDERSVPPQDEQSNYGQFRQKVLDPLQITPNQVHAINGDLPEDEAAQEYDHLLRNWAEEEQDLPRFDWVLLGIGTDGHTASLFPGARHEQEENQAAIGVTADYEGRPAQRVTLTPLILNLSRQIVFMVSGKAKSKILQEVLQGDLDPLRLPAQRIQPVEGRLVWMIDEAAASQL
jgi:6-phosphogluconolactonase